MATATSDQTSPAKGVIGHLRHDACRIGVEVHAAMYNLFPLLTSVPPHLSGEALVRQRDIIASWRAAGFKPISVNGPTEIARLAALGLDIEIEPTSEDGKPFIGDILAVIRKTGCARAGIVNADCKVLGYPDLSVSLAAALENSALYAERVDVSNDRLPTLGECNGFDAFFFDAGILGGINDTHFRLGETWWDYWFPLQLAANGAILGNIAVPLICHRRHQARWNEEQWVRHARYMCTALKAWSEQNTLLSFLSSLDGIHLNKPDVSQLLLMAAACFEWLRTRRLPREVAFLPDEMASIEVLLRDAYRSFASRNDLATVKAELATAKSERAAVKAELAAVKAESAAVKAELCTFKASTSWRVTAPLRQFATLIGQNAHRSISTNARD
jgi:hypothetical protein